MTCLLLRAYREHGEKSTSYHHGPAQNSSKIKKPVNGTGAGGKDINMLAIQLLNPGGILLTFSFLFRLMTSDLFQKIIADAAIDADVMYNL